MKTSTPADPDSPEPGRRSHAHASRVSARKIAPPVALLSLGTGSLLLGNASGIGRPDDGRLLPGVIIAGNSVGGLPVAEARNRLRDWAGQELDARLRLRDPRSNKTWSWTLAEVSGRFEVENCLQEAQRHARDENIFVRLWYRDAPRDINLAPRFVYNKARLERRLAQVAKSVHIPPVDARLGVHPKNGIHVRRTERAGIQLDIPATVAALEADSIADGAEAQLILREDPPKVTGKMLGSLGTLLASYSTYYGSSSANRKHNVRIGAQAIDGTWLEPGAVFSFNRTVGPRNATNGWKLAHQFQDGQVVDGIGGGVCQVSSTLYNAVLLGGLSIRERHNHSMPVAYLSPGRDATVSYGALDFQFENSTAAPVYIQASADNKRLVFRLFSTKDQSPSNIRVVVGNTEPRPGGGFVVRMFREWVTQTGVVRREDLGKDSYRPHPPEKKPPVAKKPQAPVASMARQPKPTGRTESPPVAPAPAPGAQQGQPSGDGNPTPS